MSNFKCEKCGAICYDTPKGYVTGCEHYPADECKHHDFYFVKGDKCVFKGSTEELIELLSTINEVSDIDRYFAEQCGYVLDDDGYSEGLEDENGFYLWTIKDPRCRQIVRERFIMDTVSGDDDWSCLAIMCDVTAIGKTIDEAEIACCEAIYEARGE